jgi:hypothetical protein
MAGNRQRDHQTAARLSAGSTRNQAASPPSTSYGAAALRSEADRVRSARVGERNDTLNSAAYSLGQLVAASALDHASAVQALTGAAADAGLEAAEITCTIESGLSAGLKQPRVLIEHGSQHLKTKIAPAEAPNSTPNPHLVLDAAIEQASAAVAQLEATRAGTQKPSYARAADVALHNGRPAYRAEPKVAR